MNKMLKVILLIILTSGLLMVGCSGESNQEGPALGRITGGSTDSAQDPQIGKPAPDFQFQNPEGQATSLSDLRGKTVLINFWTTWCPPCVYEMPHIQQVYEEWSGKGLMVLAINVGESSSKVKGFLRSEGLSLPVLLDANHDVAPRYRVMYFPTTFLIDKDGIIRGIKIGAFLSKEEIEGWIRGVIL